MVNYLRPVYSDRWYKKRSPRKQRIFLKVKKVVTSHLLACWDISHHFHQSGGGFSLGCYNWWLYRTKWEIIHITLTFQRFISTSSVNFCILPPAICTLCYDKFDTDGWFDANKNVYSICPNERISELNRRYEQTKLKICMTRRSVFFEVIS